MSCHQTVIICNATVTDIGHEKLYNEVTVMAV